MDDYVFGSGGKPWREGTPDGMDRYVVVWHEVPGEPFLVGSRHVDVVEAVDRKDALDRFLDAHGRARVEECSTEFDFVLHHDTIDAQTRNLMSEIRLMRREWEREAGEKGPKADWHAPIVCLVSFVVAFLASSVVTYLLPRIL